LNLLSYNEIILIIYSYYNLYHIIDFHNCKTKQLQQIQLVILLPKQPLSSITKVRK